MSLLLALFVVAAFAATLEGLSLPERAREVTDRAADSLRILRDPALSDAEKEQRIRRQSLRLFGLLGVLAGGSLLAMGLPLAVVWLLERAGVSSVGAVLSVLERVDFLVGVTVAGVAAWLVLRRIRA